MPEEKPPLRLLYEPDEYLCTWTVPNDENGVLPLPGNLVLGASRWAQGEIYGSVPLKWETAIDGLPGVVAFPQVINLPVLHGTLSNGGSVILLDARIHYWSDSRGKIFGRTALVGQGSGFGWRDPGSKDQVSLDEVPRIVSIDCQIGALDAAMGVGPIASVRHPRIHPDNVSDEWAATLNGEASLEWEVDGLRLKAGYDGRMRVADAYEYRLAWSPKATFTLPIGASADTTMRNYVEPLRAVLSIATGRSQPLTYLGVRFNGDVKARQVFLSECVQKPYQSTAAGVQDVKCVFRAKPDGISLLSLVLRWRELQRNHHPLIETYGAMLHASDQHPRSRYLLLIQALEGMHGFETATEYSRKTEKHQEQHKRVMAAAKDSLDPESIKFLKKSLSKIPPTSLDTALKAMLDSLPEDMLSRLDQTELVAEVKKDPKKPDSTLSALRVARNNLAHGTRGYDLGILDQTVFLLEQIVRAHALRLLGCSDEILTRVLKESG
ncbi:hypothetical protein ACSNO4_08330 [Kocuria flava]|uniref:hypothetical protein n=1 Tax=Kocuria flava TaxID=446860 RepID=UPI003F1B1F7A